MGNRCLSEYIQNKFVMPSDITDEIDASVTIIKGPPGVGKTWLLHYWKENYELSFYIDLDGHGPFQSWDGFINSWVSKLKDQQVDYIFVDHVPPKTPAWLKKFENAVLKPAKDKGTKIVIALLVPEKWGLGSSYLEENTIEIGVDYSRMKKISSKHKWHFERYIEKLKKVGIDYKSMYYSPLLVCYTLSGGIDGIHDFLKHWMNRRKEFRSFNNKEKKILSGEELNEQDVERWLENPISEYRLLARAGWIRQVASVERWQWDPIIEQALRVWLYYKQGGK